MFDYFLNRYKIFILIFTFLCYTSYHLSRKPISVVKVGVNKCIYNIIIVLWEVSRRPSPHWLCVHRTSKVVLELGHFLVALAWKKAVITPPATWIQVISLRLIRKSLITQNTLTLQSSIQCFFFIILSHFPQPVHYDKNLASWSLIPAWICM